MERYRMYLGGEWQEAASGEYFGTENPFTGWPWALIARGS